MKARQLLELVKMHRLLAKVHGQLARKAQRRLDRKDRRQHSALHGQRNDD